MVLEEDLKYRNEMESSVFDRLRQFKETENKSKENFEVVYVCDTEEIIPYLG